jgi:hypothetical protein
MTKGSETETEGRQTETKGRRTETKGNRTVAAVRLISNTLATH